MSQVARTAARNLIIDAAAAEVLTAFEAAGVRAILLKGPSLVRWLFVGRGRVYSDVDLLVEPERIDRAEAVLRQLGFEPHLDRRRMPSWWQEHAVDWRRKESPAVDLHRTLVGVGVSDARLWEVMSARTETMTVAGAKATVLCKPARALHLALHTAQDGADRGDLSWALTILDEQIWVDAAALAADLDALAPFAAGLRLVSHGRLLAARLNLPSRASVEVELRAAGAPAQALTVARLAAASGPRERVAIVRHKLLPPPTFMRHWSPVARRGRAGLALAYGQRLSWLARSAAPAVRAWWRTRRAILTHPAEDD